VFALSNKDCTPEQGVQAGWRHGVSGGCAVASYARTVSDRVVGRRSVGSLHKSRPTLLSD